MSAVLGTGPMLLCRTCPFFPSSCFDHQ